MESINDTPDTPSPDTTLQEDMEEQDAPSPSSSASSSTVSSDDDSDFNSDEEEQEDDADDLFAEFENLPNVNQYILSLLNGYVHDPHLLPVENDAPPEDWSDIDEDDERTPKT